MVVSSSGQALSCVIPELLALVGTLSTEQQKSFMGILGKAAVEPIVYRLRVRLGWTFHVWEVDAAGYRNELV